MHDAIWYMRIEAAVALLVSFFINLAVVAVNANEFYTPDCASLDTGPFGCMLNVPELQPYLEDELGSVGTCTPRLTGTAEGGSGDSGVCGDFGLESEGYALSSQLGSYTLYLWAIGLCAAGQAASDSTTTSIIVTNPHETECQAVAAGHYTTSV